MGRGSKKCGWFYKVWAVCDQKHWSHVYKYRSIWPKLYMLCHNIERTDGVTDWSQWHKDPAPSLPPPPSQLEKNDMISTGNSGKTNSRFEPQQFDVGATRLAIGEHQSLIGLIGAAAPNPRRQFSEAWSERIAEEESTHSDQRALNASRGHECVERTPPSGHTNTQHTQRGSGSHDPGRPGSCDCHTVRGTKPGEGEAAGGLVMAVREAGFSPFPFLFSMKGGKKITLATFIASSPRELNNISFCFSNIFSISNNAEQSSYMKDPWKIQTRYRKEKK